MGQILKACTDPAGEPTKQAAFEESPEDVINNKGGKNNKSIPFEQPTLKQQKQDDAWIAKQRAIREEQVRIEQIISKAGREMVNVGSTRGANYYNDQGFAAALAQHLQQTLPPAPFPRKLPEAPAKGVHQVLSQPIPVEPVDLVHQAETFLEKYVVGKEQLFAGCPPIVENLL